MERDIGIVVFVFLMSFVIDRITRIVLSVARAFKWLSSGSEGERIAYFVCAGLLAIPTLVYFEKMRVLHALQIYESGAPMYSQLDILVTALLLIGGADFLGKLIELSGAYDGDTQLSRPQGIEIGRQVHIRGTLEIIEDKSNEDTEDVTDDDRDEEDRSLRGRASR